MTRKPQVLDILQSPTRRYYDKLEMATAAAYSVGGVTVKSLFSWPPNPSLTGFHAGARALLLLNNAIGIGLCLAAGIKSRHGGASTIFAGILLCAACALVLMQLRWNIRTLRGDSDKRRRYALLDTDEAQGLDKKLMGTRMLKFSIRIDLLGFATFLCVYPAMVSDAYKTGEGLAVLYSYASVSALIPL